MSNTSEALPPSCQHVPVAAAPLPQPGLRPLPDNMLGTFQLETSEGFTNYMYEVGVDWFTRKIAYSLYPTATNELVDGQIKRTKRTKRTKLHQELHLQVREERVQSGGALHRDGVDTSSGCLSTRLLTAVQAMARARARAWRRASSARGASTTARRQMAPCQYKTLATIRVQLVW